MPRSTQKKSKLKTSRAHTARAKARPRTKPAARATRATRARRASSPARSRPSDRPLRDLLVAQLRGGHAHVVFADVLEDFPAELRGVKPPGAAHTPWQVLEHLRITQWDIVDFCRDSAHRSPAWPAGYWTQEEVPPSEAAWDASVREVATELGAMQQLVADARRDLFARIDHPEAQDHHTLAREAIVLVDHNGYHLSELVMLRRQLGAWNRS
jgi:hypothetical protein